MVEKDPYANFQFFSIAFFAHHAPSPIFSPLGYNYWEASFGIGGFPLHWGNLIGFKDQFLTDKGFIGKLFFSKGQGGAFTWLNGGWDQEFGSLIDLEDF